MESKASRPDHLSSWSGLCDYSWIIYSIKFTLCSFYTLFINSFTELFRKCNGQFRRCQSWSFKMAHGQNQSNEFGLYCHVTSWPVTIQKNAYLLFGIKISTRSKKLNRIWKSLQIGGTIHCCKHRSHCLFTNMYVFSIDISLDYHHIIIHQTYAYGI